MGSFSICRKAGENMEWGHTKTILIIAFLLLNMLLGYQLWNDRISDSGQAEETVESSRQIEQLLADKRIILKATLPEVTAKLGEIDVAFTPGYRSPDLRTLKKPVRTDDLKDRNLLKDSLLRQIPDGDSYVLDPGSGTKNRPVMLQRHGKYPMFEVKLVLYLENDMITMYTQTHVEVLTKEEQNTQKVISGLTALGILAEKYLQEDTSIVEVQLGYHGPAYNTETSLLVPSWRVRTSDGETYYVHAITGAVEKK